MKELSIKQLRNISIEEVRENYYKTLILEELGYGKNDQALKDSVGRVLYHGEVSMYDLGKEYIDGYAISLEEYFEDGEDSLFYEYCNHISISKTLTIDSSDEEFYKHIDYEKYGEDMILEKKGFFGEEFYDIDGHVLEVVDYDWLSEQNEPENTPDLIIVCYEAVDMYLKQDNCLKDAINIVYENNRGEVAQ